MKRIVGIIIALFIRVVQAQGLYDVYTMQTASADLCRLRERFMFSNPACITEIKDNTLALSEVIPYGISKLKINLFSSTFLLKNKAFAIDFMQTGFSTYNDRRVSICTGIKLNTKHTIGIKIIAQQERITREYQHNKYDAELGLIEQFHVKTTIALHLKLKLLNADKSVDRNSLSIGLNHLPIPTMVCMLNVEANELGEFLLRSGIEYSIDKQIHIRMGWSSKEAAFCGGIGYKVQRIKLDCGTAFHNRLGFSYAAGVCYSISQ